MAKFDLIPFPKIVSTLFLLESPHTDEIDKGYPCAGYAGEKMTRKIFPKRGDAFGKILVEKESGSEKFGIFNSCQFPLGLKESLKSSEIQVSRVKDVKTERKSRESIYSEMQIILSEIPDLEEITGYLSRLAEIIEESSSIKNFVVCGYIAQSFFKFYCHNKLYPYNELSQWTTKKGRVFNVLFVNHPADRKEWVFEGSKIDSVSE